jgi:hypothetical protein
MAIGSVIRNESVSEQMRLAYATRRPMVVVRADAHPQRRVDVNAWARP